MASQGETVRAHEYELGHSDREVKRLSLQARLVDPFTRQFFQEAGLAEGMRVLEVGSGAGDTALLVAQLIGDRGEVLGIDRAPSAVAIAQNRVKGLGKRNISFRQGDLDTLEFAERFDAVVGRYVLMFNPDPETMLRNAARLMRPGGVIVFHEPDWRGCRSTPVAPMYELCCEWIVRTFERVGTNPNMGGDLHATFVRAGLPAPSMALRALVGGGASEVSGVDMIAELGITMAPVMEEYGVIVRGEIDPANFRQRMLAEVQRLGSLVIGRSEIGAWSRTRHWSNPTLKMKPASATSSEPMRRDAGGEAAELDRR
jgi:SAM-dependent methyltransferase